MVKSIVKCFIINLSTWHFWEFTTGMGQVQGHHLCETDSSNSIKYFSYETASSVSINKYILNAWQVQSSVLSLRWKW